MDNLKDTMRGFNILKIKSNTYYELKIILENNIGKNLPNANFIFKTLPRWYTHQIATFLFYYVDNL